MYTNKTKSYIAKKLEKLNNMPIQEFIRVSLKYGSDNLYYNEKYGVLNIISFNDDANVNVFGKLGIFQKKK